ncbi:MAG: ArsR family transcriptional regulator [Pseudomonadota bacterium]
MAGKNDTTDRDQQILSRLAHLQHKVDSIEQTSAFALRAEAEKHLESVKAVFGKSTRKVQVYLSADGNRSVKDIANHLSMKAQHVSRDLKKLQDEGLLEVGDTDGNTIFYAKTPLDRTIRITRFLTQEFDLTKDGKPKAS